MTAWTWLLALTLRSTVVVSVALALTLLLRRQSAVARHRLLTLTAVGLLLLPALPAVLPAWELPFLQWGTEPAAAAAEHRASVPLRPAGGRSAEPAESPAAQDPPVAAASGGRIASLMTGWGTAAVVVWLSGVLASLLGLARALQRERRLVARARPLDGPWLETLAEARRALAVPRAVRLLWSEEAQTPLTRGWLRPAVLLPASAADWSEERRRLVAQHELLHVARADALRHLAWRLVAALYWFHPLARLAQRQAQLASEQACDEAVVRLGARPSSYARHLLEIAESLRARPKVLASALPMIEPSQLERRLVMILDPNRSASRTWGRAAASMGLALLALTVIGAASAGPSPALQARSAHPALPAEPAGVALVAAAADAAEPARSLAGQSPCDSWIGNGFSGTINEGPSGTDLTGYHDGDFALQHRLEGGQRLCARVHGAVRFDERNGSIRELPSGSSVLIETQAGRGGSQRMLISAENGEPRYQWWLNGQPRPLDDAARAWLADALEAVEAFRAIGALQGQVGSLQGEIGSIQGQVGTLQGKIGTIQGQVGTLQGKIGTIQGEAGTLHGEIGSHQGAIGSLQGSQGQASAARREQIDREIRTHEAAIRKLEAEMAGGGLSRRLAEAEAELRAFQAKADGQIAELRREIVAVQAEKRIGALGQQIEDLHAEERIREIERRSKPARDRLAERITQLSR